MAPEIFKGGKQTHKLDIWSSFVTMFWLLDAGDFRQRSTPLKSYTEIQQAVLSAASNVNLVSEIREMAITNLAERASAAQMLVKHFDGEGLSTPRNQVPVLSSSPPLKIAVAGTAPLSSVRIGLQPKKISSLTINAGLFARKRQKLIPQRKIIDRQFQEIHQKPS